MQARHSVISLAALARCIRRSSVVNNMSAPVSRCFLYLAGTKILVLVRRLWAGLVFDQLPRIAQPLSLGALGVALIIFGGSPAEGQRARRHVGADAQFSCAGARRDPAAPASAMAVANGEHRSCIASAGILAVKRFKNVSFSLVKTSLFDLNCGIRELRPRPQQTAKIAAGDTQLAGGLGDVHPMPAENLNHNVRIKEQRACRENRSQSWVAQLLLELRNPATPRNEERTLKRRLDGRPSIKPPTRPRIDAPLKLSAVDRFKEEYWQNNLQIRTL
jgi:hypothetical protein